ncbi:tetraacyldisaccharide 4'-kinase [Winogradskyella eckloniae]|uniref:tetraacyldisaccharide 4'-kinase n=1 Tax=Winogradskyella eckloniae TaxID=1089306 RepID=UPI00156592D4|nr:tetraacyldisaccharide 4'-kinase [Winogradskyella eckloniae]NRD20914.1 tetraacyldisaccharide 4'-kinase [Winogradskyella eckloniae]
MKFLRIILFPFVPIYFLITWLRNWMYDLGFISSKSYDFPIICVGNLSTGGTGKTPMIEYLVRLLREDRQLATLSRGYKRKTKGFVLADQHTNADKIGDEPFQFYKKFSDISVAVDEDRQNGIAKLMGLKTHPDVILLDDAYQHRKVKAKCNIMLTAYNNLYFKDWVLPTGNLREPRLGAKRADIIVVTKCNNDLSEAEKFEMASKMNLKKHQQLFFSYIDYAPHVKSESDTLDLEHLPEFLLVTGIANANPLVEFLTRKGLKFSHLEFRDHYDFKPSDIEKIVENKLIVTTEKDFVRLSGQKELHGKLYYLPIEVKIDNATQFDGLVKRIIN